MMRWISFSRPTQGSSFPSAAAAVRSVPKVSSTGVFEAGFFCAVVAEVPLPADPAFAEVVSSYSSSSSSDRPMPLVMPFSFWGANSIAIASS